MSDAFAAAVHDWETYFLLMGTAGATLVGLEFVAASLASTLLGRRNYKGINTFVTPTLLHFVYVLAVAAIFLIPHVDSLVLGMLLGVAAASGLGLILPRSREVMEGGSPDRSARSNWIWYFVVPFVAYLLLLVAVPFLVVQEEWSMFIVAGGTLLLLIIGIRNSWDLVLWIAAREGPKEQE